MAMGVRMSRFELAQRGWNTLATATLAIDLPIAVRRAG